MSWYTIYDFTVYNVELTDKVREALRSSSYPFTVRAFGPLIKLDVVLKHGGRKNMRLMFTEIASIFPDFTKITCRISPGNGAPCGTYHLDHGTKDAVRVEEIGFIASKKKYIKI